LAEKADTLPESTGSGFGAIDEDEGIDLRHYWRVILRYRWGILGLVVAVGLFTTVWAYSLQPIYRSTATLLIGGNETVTVSDAGKDQGWTDKSKFLGTQYELLKSREVALVTLDGLGDDARASIAAKLSKDSGTGFDWRNWVPQSWLATFNVSQNQISDADPDKDVLNWLRSNLQIQPVRDTSMVQVSFEATDPRLAARVANAFTKAYVDYNLQRRVESTTEASEWLQKQLVKSQQHFLEAVDKLQHYREQAGLVDIEGMESVQTEQLKVIAAKLSEAQLRRAEAEQLYLRAKRLQAVGQMDAIPEVLNNPWIQRLRDKEQELELRLRADKERFKGDYPGLDETNHDLQAIRDQIDAAYGKLVETYKTDYENAKANEEHLQSDLKKYEARVQALSHKQLDAQALEQLVSTNRQSYEAFLNQLTETSARSADDISLIARVVDRAVPDFTPVKPNKRRMVIMGILLALMGGLGIALMLDKFDNTLKSRADVEEQVGIPVLGEVEFLKGTRADGEARFAGTEFQDEPQSSFAESIRTIRTGVALSGLDQAHQSLVVTSTVGGEGKSTVALNLAMALAQLGNVLLIEADLRRPSLAKVFGVDATTPGLTDLVAGTAKVKECIRCIPGSMHVLFAGSSLPPDPLKVLSSERFADVLSKIVATYDSVVIDSAPVELVSDARILATKADGLIYVIKAGETPHQAVRQGLAALSETGAPLLGAVLNQINPRELHSYGKYRYGYSRYGRYSYGQGGA